MLLFTFTILENGKSIIWPVPAVVLGVADPKRAYSTPFWTWPGPAECLWSCPSELRQFSSCCLPLPKLRPFRPIFVSLWRVVAAIAALFQVPWRRKKDVGQSCPQHRLLLRSISVAQNAVFAHGIMAGTYFITYLASLFCIRSGNVVYVVVIGC